MKLQELTKKYDLNIDLIKSFFLGVLNSKKPMKFEAALDELLEHEADAKGELAGELQTFWKELESKKIQETQNLFAAGDLELSKDKLDQFLTAMSLCGTHSESVDEEIGEIIDELEEMLEDMEDYLTEDKPDAEEGEEMKESLTETWQAFIEAKNF